jgi:hypothetical protein
MLRLLMFPQVPQAQMHKGVWVISQPTPQLMR